MKNEHRKFDRKRFVEQGSKREDLFSILEKRVTDLENINKAKFNAWNRSDKIALAAFIVSLLSLATTIIYTVIRDSQQDIENKQVEIKRDSVNQAMLTMQTKPNRPFLTVKAGTVKHSAIVRRYVLNNETMYFLTIEPAFIVTNVGSTVADGMKVKYAVIATDALYSKNVQVAGPYDNSCLSGVLNPKDSCQCRTIMQTGVPVALNDNNFKPRYRYYLVMA